jgi:hypothetical protein
LYGLCHRLESYCHAAEALAAARAEVVIDLIQFWHDSFECLACDTLFVALREGRLLEVVLAEIG